MTVETHHFIATKEKELEQSGSIDSEIDMFSMVLGPMVWIYRSSKNSQNEMGAERNL